MYTFLNKNKLRILLVLLLILIIAFFSKIKIPCIIHELTGIFCPGCGMTRSLFAYLKFDFISAIKYNPLSLILIYGYIKTFILGKIKFNKIEITIFLTSTILYTIIRNIY